MFRDPTGMGWFGNLAKDGKDIAQGVFDAIVSDITGQDIRTGDQSSRLYRASKLGAHAADVYVGTKLTIVGAGAEVAGVVAAPETGGASLSITVAGAGLTAGGVWFGGNAMQNATQILSQMSQSGGGENQENTNKVEGLIEAGNAPDKGGLTAAGRALQKHGSREGSVFPKATGNSASINAQGESVLKGIVTHPDVISTTRHHARFGDILEYKIPGGQGARFSSDGKTFIGFIEP
jgi:hypothetical protein